MQSAAMRWRHTYVIALSTVALCLAGCGGDASAEDSSPEASEDTSATPSASPTPAGQPEGRYGNTYRIQNWDEFSQDQAVLAVKRAAESYAGSVNNLTVQSDLLEFHTKNLERWLVREAQFAWKNSLSVAPVSHARVLSSQKGPRKATVVACHWLPTFALLKKDGKMYGNNRPHWLKVRFGLVMKNGHWALDTADGAGNCPGGAPQ